MYYISTWSRLVILSYIAKNSTLLHPVGLDPCLSVPLGALSLKTPTGFWFGEPLPHQQPDQPQTHPIAELNRKVKPFGF